MDGLAIRLSVVYPLPEQALNTWLNWQMCNIGWQLFRGDKVLPEEQEATNQALAEQLRRECDELALMEFDDVGTEDEWLVVQNEALHRGS
ncbi:MAG: hypothetical protein AB1791_04830 [Chloroflexota bacterium]